MTLALQILLLILLLVGLVTIFMSTKNWHWSQIVLLLFILLTTVGFLFLAAETIRIHNALRSQLPRLEQRLATLERQNVEMLKGTDDRAGIRELEHRLQMISRERGRVWRGTQPVGPLDEQGRVEVEVPNPQPHMLTEGMIVFAFEAGEPNPQDPVTGRQYLGEFKVVQSNPVGVVLESVQSLTQRAGQRIAESEGPWSLYESMPADRHRMFADMSEEELRSILPEETVEEYIRHGTPATPDDDQWHVIGLDENGERVLPDNLDQAVTKLYDRPLRNYSYLFAELARQRSVLLAKRDALREDNALLEEALASAEKLGEFRREQIERYSSDLEGMRKDREAIEGHLATVNRQLENARQLISRLLEMNSNASERLTTWQLELRQSINETAPAPAAVFLP